MYKNGIQDRGTGCCLRINTRGHLRRDIFRCNSSRISRLLSLARYPLTSYVHIKTQIHKSPFSKTDQPPDPGLQSTKMYCAGPSKGLTRCVWVAGWLGQDFSATKHAVSRDCGCRNSYSFTAAGSSHAPSLGSKGRKTCSISSSDLLVFFQWLLYWCKLVFSNWKESKSMSHCTSWRLLVSFQQSPSSRDK